MHVPGDLRAKLPAMKALLERLVRLETPSHDLHGLRAAQHALADALNHEVGVGGSTMFVDTANGPILDYTLPGDLAGETLLLGHMDTVYMRGAWSNLWRLDGDRAYGPGVYDMKGGLVQAAFALAAIADQRRRPSVRLLVTPDEETGSLASREIIEEAARRASRVLVLEPPASDGALKVARKGVGQFTLTFSGRAAHQGTEPELGANAVIEAARAVLTLLDLQDLAAGTTIGPNVISGGTVSNVVADSARLDVDVRVWTEAEAARVEAAVRSFITRDPRVLLVVDGGLNRPAMEPSAGALEIAAQARSIAETLGFSIGIARVGGASDGNFTAPFAPTLDGLGAMGGEAHQRDREWVRLTELPLRATLLAGLLVV